MREHCRHSCHASNAECDPCHRLHELADRMHRWLDAEAKYRRGQVDTYPTIGDELLAAAKELERAQAYFDHLVAALGPGYALDDSPYPVATAMASRS